jgi:magnesium transporter
MLAMEGALQSGERPTFDRFPAHTFALTYDAHLCKVTLFLGERWVVTVRSTNSEGMLWDAAPIRSRLAADHGHPSVAHLTYLIFDALVDGHEDRADELRIDVEAIEDRVLAASSAPTQRLEPEVLRLRRSLLEVRRVIAPTRDVLMELRRGLNGTIDPETELRFADVHDHILRVVEQIDTQRELLGNAFEVHLAIMSNQMNLVMKKLTAWGSILFGAALISGIYGMNFTNMPELRWQVGYPLALGMMVVQSLVLHRIFRKRGWL